MPKYIYDGPVKEFDKLISEHWKGVTIAPSEAKARSNLAYQYKREMHKTPNSKIKITGKLMVVD